MFEKLLEELKRNLRHAVELMSYEFEKLLEELKPLDRLDSRRWCQRV